MPEAIMGVMILAAVIAILKGLFAVIKMMISKMTKEKRAIASLFNGSYADSRALFMYLVGEVPSVSFIKGINVNDAVECIRKDYALNIIDWYQYTAWNFNNNELEFNIAIYLMKNNIMIEFGNDYAEILFPRKMWAEAKDLATLLASYKAVPAADDEICWSRHELRTFVAERLN